MEFDRQQIEKALPGYIFQNQLGCGSMGRVYLVTQATTQRKLALKKINCFGMGDYEKKNAMNQVRILGSLNHQRIVKMESCKIDSQEQHIYILMDYADGGDLSELITQNQDKKKRINQNIIWKVISDIAQGLVYLHINQIVHRDIKPANIFKFGGSYKLGDMNVSKVVNHTIARTQIGSPYYTAPQVWDSQGYDQKCDIWSLGVVAYELCCLKVPYEANSIDQLIKKYKFHKINKIPTLYSYSLQQLINKMLQKNPQKRISANDIVDICQKLGKIRQQKQQPNKQLLMDTIMFPQPNQKWINLIPLPPKLIKKDSNKLTNSIKKDNSKQKNQSKQKQNNIILDNINIQQNYSCCAIPHPKLRKQNKSCQQKQKSKSKSKIRLPSISKKNSIIQLNKKQQQDQQQLNKINKKDIFTSRKKRNLFGGIKKNISKLITQQQ